MLEWKPLSRLDRGRQKPRTTRITLRRKTSIASRKMVIKNLHVNKIIPGMNSRDGGVTFSSRISRRNGTWSLSLLHRNSFLDRPVRLSRIGFPAVSAETLLFGAQSTSRVWCQTSSGNVEQSKCVRSPSSRQKGLKWQTFIECCRQPKFCVWICVQVEAVAKFYYLKRCPGGWDLKPTESQKGSALMEGVHITGESVTDVNLLLDFKGCVS